MVRREEVVYTDDITGQSGASTHEFGLDGTQYEIDLVPVNREKLDEALAPFVEHARRVGGKRKARTWPAVRSEAAAVRSEVAKPAVNREDNAAIRAWWGKNWKALDLPVVSDRGRIPKVVLEAHLKANHAAVAAIPEPEVPAAANVASTAVRAGRTPKPVPPLRELESVWSQAKSYTGVADFFGVSVSTATKWVKNNLAA